MAAPTYPASGSSVQRSVLSDAYGTKSVDYIQGTREHHTVTGVGALLGGLSACTLSMWLRPDSTGTTTPLAIKFSNNTPKLYIQIRGASNDITAFVTPTSGDTFAALRSNAVVDESANAWYHCVFTMDIANELGVVYVNNSNETALDQLSGLGFTATTFDGDEGSPSTMAIYFNQVSFTYDGHIGDVMLFNKALNASEVSTIYNNGSYININNTSLVGDCLWWLRMGDDAADTISTINDQVGTVDATGVNIVNSVIATDAPGV